MVFRKHNYKDESRSRKSEDDYLSILRASGSRVRASGFIALFTLLILLQACNDNKIFEEHKKLNNYSWNHFEKISFDVKIEDPEVNYDVSIAIRYIHGVPYKIIKTGMLIKYPEGEERYKDYDLNIRNNDGSYKGSVAGDIWDCSIPVLKNYSFSQKGEYSFIIHNLREKLETPGLMEIGLIVEKSELKF